MNQPLPEIIRVSRPRHHSWLLPETNIDSGLNSLKWLKYYGNLSSKTLDTSSVNVFKLPLRTSRSHIKDQAGEGKEKGTVRKGDREKRL